MKVLIVCSIGMSSNALMMKIRKTLQNLNQTQIKVGSCPANQISRYIDDADIVLLSPHVEYIRDELENKYYTKEFISIPSNIYGLQDSEEIVRMITQGSDFSNSNIKFSKIRNGISTFGNNNIIQSINHGMISTLPITVVGSLLLLLKTIPFEAISNLINESNIGDVLQLGINMTTGAISIYTVYFIASNLASALKVNEAQAGLNSLISFFIFIGRDDQNNINRNYLGVNGLFTAIGVAVLTTYIYSKTTNLISSRGLSKHGESENSNLPTFKNLLPIATSILVSLILVFLADLIAGKTPQDLIYNSIQITLTNFSGNNIFSELFFTLITGLFWFIGIHGGGIVGAITKPIYSPLSLANLYAYSNKLKLPYIINTQFKYMYNFGGAGSTLGLAILMVYFSKSKKMRTIGKISLPLGIFYINEPIIFGIPIVLNPILVIPFVLIPVTSGLFTFMLMKYDILPYAVGLETPWTTPPIISGFIQGGVRLAFWQIFLIVYSMIFWYPFFKIQDKRYLEDESM